MMRKLIMMGIAMMAIAISSCDEDTAKLGNTLTSNIDKFQTISANYEVQTRSLMTDSVLATSLYRYLGKIKDPETGAFITSDYMTQFNMLENEITRPDGGLFPSKDYTIGDPVADSCVIRIMINSFQGDSLAAMKLLMTELAEPVPNSSKYYSDFDPASDEHNYLRTSAGGIRVTKTYSVSDLTMTDSLRNVLRGSNYYKYITIPLNMDYIDKNNTPYKGYDDTKKSGTGYGSYIMSMYYAHPEYFKNSNQFTRNICPGFYFQCIDGLGNMIEVAQTQIIVYYHFTSKATETVVNTSRVITSSEEVLQTNHIINDKKTIQALEKADTCTFLKTPSGIFTEVTLPIDQIKWLEGKDSQGNTIPSHINDTIVSAKLTFQQIKSQNPLSKTLLEDPSDLLLVPKDRLYSFFENSSLPDNITTYLATYNSVQKSYSFNTLTGLINTIWSTMKKEVTNADGSINQAKLAAYEKAHPDYNKVVLVPVDIEITYSSSSSSAVTSVYNSMAISSIRLIGGENSKYGKIYINMMYSKNK